MAFRLQVAVLAASLACAACGMGEAAPPRATPPPAAPRDVPPRGMPGALDVASWNIEWFGSRTHGPTDEALQLANAHDVIAGTDADVWGIAEVADDRAWDALLTRLGGGYAGILVTDRTVRGGASAYRQASQRVGVIYKPSIATPLRSRVILSGDAASFAGRPPLEVTFRVTLGGATRELVVIVLHMKAFADEPSWRRRRAAADALERHLDQRLPSAEAIVVGDWNDDVDRSIVPGRPSPFAALVADSARHRFVTRRLSDAGISTTTRYRDAVDHHLVTDELAARELPASAEAYRVDGYVPYYATTTSDHFPVLSHYAWSGAPGAGAEAVSARAPAPAAPGVAAAAPTDRVLINEVLANEPGSDTAGEFVELVNAGPTTVDLGGWTLADADAVRHRFPRRTLLAPGRAIVVYGAAAAMPREVAGAVGASTGGLHLSNGRDRVVLRDGNVVADSVAYDRRLSGTDGVSMTRARDGDPAAGFVLHTTISARRSSPGARADGRAF